MLFSFTKNISNIINAKNPKIPIELKIHYHTDVLNFLTLMSLICRVVIFAQEKWMTDWVALNIRLTAEPRWRLSMSLKSLPWYGRLIKNSEFFKGDDWFLLLLSWLTIACDKRCCMTTMATELFYLLYSLCRQKSFLLYHTRFRQVTFIWRRNKIQRIQILSRPCFLATDIFHYWTIR